MLEAHNVSFFEEPCPTDWFAPVLKVKNGAIEVPQEPGLGMSIDPKILQETKIL